MKYSRVYLESFGYELPPVVVSTSELESRLEPLYQELRLPAGQLELLTGISERRWWERDYSLSDGATAAAKKALESAQFPADQVDMLIYAGVCREQFEPATACNVAAKLGIHPDATMFDLSNACLGVLNGIVEIANRIELGQARAGMVVSCETAREINEITISQMLQDRSIDRFRHSLATLTGGSGAVAVLVVDEKYSMQHRRKLLGGVTKNAPQHNGLCRWGLEELPKTIEKYLGSDASSLFRNGLNFGLDHCVRPFMATDAGAVLKYGVELGLRTWKSFQTKLGWAVDSLDKVICHQVGAGHREAILRTLGIAPEKEFSTYQFLGNIGTVSLPLTAALAEERDFLRAGDRVGFLGIGSGLNCLMLGIQW
ncbi:3-oxoacyl-ACP synthase III [Tuwongella immobilis]|uniref:Beta-ketoacyl-[acyl-carrier-protein] synthase III C-terminal domain-containing protein n=1 Tax=Tuwongella immobilis TaxID=692036 RepID=A0A6C2YP78_9BACT|nr:3-oxoacyl-ACP synthase III [Tuwongella immobilis]VIP03204.1 3-oxoacyl-acp synthase : 3-oxoacyl-(Acyl-carrier-protein) synthase III OS=Singulisphaera acidiphila (strain ATCC BAA-1392 / DSM 18658 / VKM B-2454 / MOB10) GN=Sinac_3638 PE=4 SV=1: Thiolase_N: ACP_syn_III_C [Tuwongella immobilis]VTS03699.1 3-oxoacyl-acp synthase : 3-oxoacyl-(Acyl-carrier-protein) synthase III OS=Singulisphaera acidiphila (strain ATCC BAA-1392 / DSM 18658 / VKM B-2454 / MOB10) GN=Sinac_3638 PE=4 SV=1: Thiolase_N: ACP_s